MTDKVQKIRAEVERLINQKDENKYLGIVLILELKKVLSFIDSMQEEPKKCMYSKDNYTDEDRNVLCDGCKEGCEYSKSDDFTKVLAECINQAKCNVFDSMVLAELWKDELIKLAKSEEPVSEELGDYINELSKQFPEVSFAKLSRIAVRVAKWQKQQIKKAMDLGEPPYLISVEQAYYRTLKLLED